MSDFPELEYLIDPGKLLGEAAACESEPKERGDSDEAAEQTSSRLAARRYAISAVLLALFAFFVYRLIWLQLTGQDDATEPGACRSVREVTIPAPPGDLIDRCGRLLASSLNLPDLYLYPAAIEDPRELAASVAPAIGLDPDQLLKLIGQNRHRARLLIKRRLPPSEANAIRRLNLLDRSAELKPHYERRYPNGSLARDLLGWYTTNGKPAGGVEQQFAELIQGEAGKRVLVCDAAGRLLLVQEQFSRAPRPGRTLQLTIDAIIQTFAELALDQLMRRWEPQSASAIVLDPHAGELLAVANRPAADAAGQTVRNRCIADSYEPAETIGPFVFAAASEQHMIDPAEQIDCRRGVMELAGELIESREPNALLAPEQILVRADAVGLAAMGERLGHERLCQWLRAFGFGAATGVELPGESPGSLPCSPGSVNSAAAPLAAGRLLTVTPLQLAVAFASLANGGRAVKPTIVLRPDIYGGTLPGTAQAGRQIIGFRTARFIVTGPLRRAVDEPSGAARLARLAAYSLFATCGSARAFDRQMTPRPGRHVCWFLAGAPTDAPRIIVLLVVNDPSGPPPHGADRIAGPAAATILKRSLGYLRVPPDRNADSFATQHLQGSLQ